MRDGVRRLVGDNFEDWVSRVFWTFVQAFIGALVAAGLGVGETVVWEDAFRAGCGAAVAVLTILARQRVAVATAATEVGFDPEVEYGD